MIESFRFQDEIDYEYESLWPENMKAIVILLLVLARMLYWWDKVSIVRGFIILRSGEGLTSLNKDNSDDFFGEKKKKQTIKLSGVTIF